MRMKYTEKILLHEMNDQNKLIIEYANMFAARNPYENTIITCDIFKTQLKAKKTYESGKKRIKRKHKKMTKTYESEKKRELEKKKKKRSCKKKKKKSEV